MPIVFIHQAGGRSVAQKRAVAARVTAAITEEFKVKPDAVTVFFEEYEPDNWGMAGRLHGDGKAGHEDGT